MNQLVGRDHSLSTLVDHLGASLGGSGGCLLVEGAIGIGKTRLLKAAEQRGNEHGFAVISGRASRSGHPTLVRLAAAYVRQVLPDDADLEALVHPGSNPFWLMERLGGLLEKAALSRPILIVVDDVQWTDEVGGLVLQGLVESLAASPVLWLLARRPVPAHSLAQHAINWLVDRAAVPMRLGPLDEAAVAALCGGILEARPDASVLGWAGRCGGNPRLLRSLLGAFRDEGQVVTVDGTASVLADRLPEGFRADVERLLDELPPAVRTLLRRSGALGPAFTLDEAASALGGEADGLPAAVDEAVRLGLMHRNDAKLGLTHEVIGEALHQDAPHRTNRPALQVPAPRAATGAAIRVGVGIEAGTVPRDGMSGGVAVAERPEAPEVPAGGCDGTAERAVAALRDLPGGGAQALGTALRLLAEAGRDGEAARLAGLAAGPGLEGEPERRLLLDLARGSRDAGRPSPVPRPRRAPDRETDRDAAADGARPMWAWLVHALIATDRFEEAAAVLARIGRDTGPRWHGYRAGLLAAAGRLDEARSEAESGLEAGRRAGPGQAVHARAVLARISLHGGEVDTAGDHLRVAERSLQGAAAADRTGLDWALAQFHLAGGRPVAAMHALVDVAEGRDLDALFLTEAPTAAAMAVRLAMRAGLDAQAARAAGLARRMAGANPAVGSLAGGAEHAEGLLRRDPVTLHRAAERYRLSGRPLAAGVALEDAAREVSGTRQRNRAVRLLESALELYSGCGARHDAVRVQRKLRRLDRHTARVPAADRTRSGWDSLTSAELRVVREIVDGRTNREAANILFLSPHTVDSHLRRVFSKLDINSRVELTKLFLAHESSVRAF